MTHHYAPSLVLLSLAISLMACWTALELSCRVHAQRSLRARSVWLGMGALVMGLGIWAMHYVGMLAYRVNMPVAYHLPTVFLSLAAAVVSSALALWMVSRAEMPAAHTAVGGLVMGLGIAAMHYIGMAAMRMPCSITYSKSLVALSLFLAVAISMVALRLCFLGRDQTDLWSIKKISSALLMGMAIPTMHYVGMAAAHMGSMTAGAGRLLPTAGTIQVSQLGTTSVVSCVVLCLGFALLLASANRDNLAFEENLQQSREDHEQLATYQQRLMQAYRQNGVGAWEWQPATNRFAVDDSVRRIYDFDSSEGLHVPRSILLERVHPDDHGLLHERWNAALSSGSLYENEYRIVHRNGAQRRCRSVATIFRNANGEAVSVLGMSWDVTAERQQQLDHASQARRFYLTLEAIGDAVLSVDAESRIIYANPIACKLTGWRSEECPGRSLAEVFIAMDELTGQLRRDPVKRCMELGGSLLSEDAILISRDGSRFNIRKHVNLVDQQGGAVLTFQDITAARQLERDLQRAATHDSLTGLPNRAAFEKRLEAVWEFERMGNRLHSLAILDLDRFKLVNDTSGHAAGDALLRNVVQLLQSSVPSNGYIARMGGDEFLFLLMDTTHDKAEQWSRAVLRSMQALEFAWHKRPYSVTGSIGLVFFDGSSASLQELTSQADVALFTAKRNGRNQLCTYQAGGDVAGNMQEMEAIAQIRSALEEDRFVLHAQPIVPLHGSGGEYHYEVLVRMLDGNGSLVPPANFIPAAECYGMMQEIDRWVIRNALASIAKGAPSSCSAHFALNLSGDSLSDITLWDFVEEQFRTTGTPPSSITFEVTESSLIRNMDAAGIFLRRAQQAGCRIALDDFGTGMSSLSYLKQFPLNAIKIDGSFVRRILSTPLDQSIVRAISQIAHAMGATTVAECAEDTPTVDLLTTLKVDFVQGWATGRPEPLAGILLRLAPSYLEPANIAHTAAESPLELFPGCATLSPLLA